LDEVQKEIDELRKLLEKKQKEAADLRTEMFGFEDSISRVRVKFSRQLTRVDKKERALKESRSEWELEDATHKKQKEAHELQV
jgi:predicted  nucleic acid-binding Zn-ribbon protein